MRRMRLALGLILTPLAVLACAMMALLPAQAQQSEQRFGLVIGNGEYAAGALPTAANDAGLVAQTLQAAGFDVMGARDLDGDALRNTFRDFVDKVAAAGPNAVAFVYLSGHALQYEGENYFVPVDARIERDVEVPLRALRINDYVRPLGASNPKAVIVVLDAARETPFARGGQPLAGGLALVEPAGGLLYAYNAAPGTIAPPGQPPYSPYAQALAEMMREGGLRIETVFDRVRLRVHNATSGAEVPWHASALKTPVVFFERGPDAPPEVSITTTETRRARPVQSFDDAREAYLAALERDTLQGYQEFLSAYPTHPLAKRVHAIVAARREAITWRRTRNADTPEAYWSYLDRYPTGPHAHDARRRLAYLTAPPEPPPRYTAFVYDIPPPPPEEIIYVRRSYMYFADPIYAFVEPPPPPIYFLPPPPPPFFFVAPPRPIAIFVLPVPVYRPVPVYVRAPVYVRPPPPTNVIFPNLHKGPPPTPVVQPAAPAPAAPGGPPAPAKGLSPGTVATVGVAAGAAAAAAAVTLPPSVQRRAATMPPPTTPGSASGTATGTPPAARPQVMPTGLPAGAGTGAPGLPQAPGTKAPSGAPGAAPSAPPSPSTIAPPPAGRPLPGAPAAQPLPKPPAGVPSPSQVPGTKALTGVPGAPSPSTIAPPPAGRPLPGAPAAQPLAKPPAGGQPPPPGPSVVRPPAPGQPPPRVATPPPPATPQATPRQDRVDRAQQDRGAVERQLQQQRQQEMDRRRQEAAQQQQARQSQQQAQEVQRQRQQQMDAQRRQMEAQRQQQVQQQQQQRMQQQMQQQQAAQARAQAEAQARARAAQQQQQQQRPRCGAPGLPPCPR